MDLFSKEDIPWTVAYIKKELVFLLIINLVILSILLFLQIPLGAYSLILLFEGFCLVILGVLSLFLSLFSTVERYNYRYVGRGITRSLRRDIVVRELRSQERKRMRQGGVIMIFLGLLFWVVVFLVLGLISMFYSL